MDQVKDKKGEQEQQKIKARIVLSSRSKVDIEKTSARLIENAKKQDDIKVAGPKRMPIKRLAITTRRTPCGNGSKTWDKYEMNIYKRVIDFTCTSNDVKTFTSMTIPSGVDINLIVESK